MKQSFRTVILVALSILLVLPAFGQDEAEKEKAKPTVVVSSNKVPLAKMDRYVELTNKYWAPAFDKLVDDGKLWSWGYITHAWGDEWNVVVHYTATDFATFQSAWSEGLEGVFESIPEEESGELIGMIKAHKDGIYTGEHFYDGRPMTMEGE
jgi:hypothetical protein